MPRFRRISALGTPTSPAPYNQLKSRRTRVSARASYAFLSISAYELTAIANLSCADVVAQSLIDPFSSHSFIITHSQGLSPPSPAVYRPTVGAPVSPSRSGRAMAASSDASNFMSDAQTYAAAQKRPPGFPSSSSARPRGPPSEMLGPGDDGGDGFADDQVPRSSRVPDAASTVPRVEDRIGLLVQEHFEAFLER